MRAIKVIDTLAAMAVVLLTIDFTYSMNPSGRPVVRVEPEVILKVDELMEELREFANNLPTYCSLLKGNVLKLENNVRMLIRMESTSHNKILTYVFQELDDFFKPDNPDYWVHNPPDIPPIKYQRYLARTVVRSVMRRLQHMWLTRIVEDEHAKTGTQQQDNSKPSTSKE